MIALPIVLVNPAKEAGIEIPPDPEKGWDMQKYVRWSMFCAMQIGVPMPHPHVHFDNAKVIAQIPEDRLQTITSQEIINEFGFQVGLPKE